MKRRSLNYNANGHHGILGEDINNILLLFSPFLVGIFSPVPNLRHVAIHS